MRRGRVAAAVLAMVLVAPLPVSAQQQIQTSRGTIEVLGLRRWTIQMIADSAAKYAPGQDLASHACAAVLRFKLGFADASVTQVRPRPSSDSLLYIVTVIEPQDSALVRYKDVPLDSAPTPEAWRAAVEVFTAHNREFQRAIQTRGFLTADTLDPDTARTFGPALPLRAFVRSHRDPADFTRALYTLGHDGNGFNRMLAVLLLQNFLAQDPAWWALVDALRDPNDFVNGTASQLLGMLTWSSGPRRIDWAPITPVLRALLDGTNLFAHTTVMAALASTQVDPTLAPALLRGGGTLVLTKLGSHDPFGRVAAHHLLVQLAGHDLGFDVSAWQRWLDRL